MSADTIGKLEVEITAKGNIKPAVSNAQKLVQSANANIKRDAAAITKSLDSIADHSYFSASPAGKANRLLNATAFGVPTGKTAAGQSASFSAIQLHQGWLQDIQVAIGTAKKNDTLERSATQGLTPHDRIQLAQLNANQQRRNPPGVTFSTLSALTNPYDPVNVMRNIQMKEAQEARMGQFAMAGLATAGAVSAGVRSFGNTAINLGTRASPIAGERLQLAQNDLKAVIGRSFVPVIDDFTEITRNFADRFAALPKDQQKSLAYVGAAGYAGYSAAERIAPFVAAGYFMRPGATVGGAAKGVGAAALGLGRFAFSGPGLALGFGALALDSIANKGRIRRGASELLFGGDKPGASLGASGFDASFGQIGDARDALQVKALRDPKTNEDEVKTIQNNRYDQLLKEQNDKNLVTRNLGGLLQYLGIITPNEEYFDKKDAHGLNSKIINNKVGG